MLSLFPTLLSWQQVSPFLIRITLAVIFLHWSYRQLMNKSGSSSTKLKVFGIADAILGVLLIIGLWTQLAAILIGLDMLWRIAKKIKEKAFFSDGVNYYFIILVLSISLLVTGAGIIAIDYGL